MGWKFNSGGMLPTFTGNFTVTGNLTVGGQILAADGTVGAPSVSFTSDIDTGFYKRVGDAVAVSLAGVRQFEFESSQFDILSNTGAIVFGAASDLVIRRDAANVLAQRNGTNAQIFRLSETYTDISNRAGLSLSAAAGGPYVVTPEAVGTGVLRGLQLAATSGLIGFMGATPVVRQTDGAALTNGVTVGGTTDTIADFTNLTVYATDAATIRNDIYQLARKIKIVDDALRLYGLLT